MHSPACTLSAAACVALTLLVPSAARAAEPDADSGGFWAFGGASVGVGSGTYRHAGLSALGYTPRRELVFAADMHPKLFALSGGLGYRASRFTALGVGGDVELLFQSDVRLSEATFQQGYLASAGLYGELRPMTDGLFVIWNAGVAQASFMGNRSDVGSPDNIVDLEKLTGYVAALGLGWSFGTVAPFARVSRAELSAGQTTFRPVLLNLGVVFQSW